MSTSKIYKIGTRGSLLALTQCLQLKDQMESMGLGKFELEIIKTQGDEDTSKPLWQLDGKDFFTKELDAALLNKKVDLVVHSYKDLGSERPEGITLAAVTKRKYPHDILFIKKSVVKELQTQKREKIIVGTSSPRRMTNITKFLNHYLPYGEDLVVETKSLRGNVNTRLEKCLGNYFDAIVLALPGIERLAQGLKDENNEAYARHGDPREILASLLESLDYMILPTSQFPAAASQGALGVECLEDNSELRKKLAQLNCERTISEVAKEREVFASFGGGCHLAVGITARNISDHVRLNIRGVSNEQEVDKSELLTKKDSNLSSLFKRLNSKQVFIGVHSTSNDFTFDHLIEKKALTPQVEQDQQLSDILFSSGKALEFGIELARKNPQAKLWSSGTRTWKKMARAGLWCNGSADALGESELSSLRSSQVVSLLAQTQDTPKWCVVTNNTSENILGERLGVYENILKDKASLNDEFVKRVEEAKIFYWTSFSQYQQYNNTFSLRADAIHFSGLGKTYAKFRENNIDIQPISGMKEFKNLCKDLL